MTIGEIIELVFLKVNGDKPTPDNAVMRADIRVMLPAAINYAMDKVYNLNLKIEGDRDYPSEFYSVFKDVPIDRSGRLPFFEMTTGSVPLKGGAGLRFVYDNCGVQYSPVADSDLATIEYYSKLTPGMGWYRPTGSSVVLYGINPLAEKISYQQITRIEDLSDTDEAPLQAGSEVDVLQYLREWFSNKTPYDTLVNTRDTNAADA